MKNFKLFWKKGFSLFLCLILVAGMAGCSKDKDSEEADDKVTGTATWEEGELTSEHTGGVKDASVILDKVEGMPENFIKAMDVSSIISLEQAGVTYHNEDGNEEDLLKILADAGYNYVRIRVWNNPYNSKGNGYGGGNCDLEKAKEIGKRATDNGLRVIIDFHYSDFWCDPDKQQVPKAWSEYNYEGKKAAMADYTEDSLNELIDAGVDVGMVQIGNETNGVFCGETNW
ncbi:MAG: glycosyl hydrolase 53 family protein, partial [Eubacterium sp.]